MSILTHIYRSVDPPLPSVHLLYSSKVPSSGDESSILFFSKLDTMFDASRAAKWQLQFFLTGLQKSTTVPEVPHDATWSPERSLRKLAKYQRVHYRRMRHTEALHALGPVEERDSTMAYVCGPRDMTDEVVDLLRGAEGMTEERVRCEKWW